MDFKIKDNLQKSKSLILTYVIWVFLCPRNRIRGGGGGGGVSSFFSYLSVTLWQKNVHLGDNFWTVQDRDFILGMHAELMKPF